MDLSSFGEDPKEIMGEILDMAEAMVQPLLDKARSESSTNEEYRLRITKITLALGVGLAVIGERYYKQKAGPELYSQMVAQLVKDAMERMIGTMEEVKGADDGTAAEAAGSAWSKRRVG